MDAVSSKNEESLAIDNNDAINVPLGSFIDMINTSNHTGAALVVVAIFIGLICLGINNLFGILVFGVLGWLLYKTMKDPQYKIRKNINMAKKFIRSSELKDSLPFLHSVLKIEKENCDANYMLGVVSYMIGSYEQSIESLKKYVELQPNNFDAKLVLANNYYVQHDYEKVIPILQQFSDKYPHQLLVILLLGDSFLSLKKYDEAIEVFKRGPLRKRKLDGQLLQLHYYLAAAYEGSEQKSKALKELKKIYAFDINYRNVAKEIERLEKSN
jgi:tetratricopeptide (TPR) repeat protein